MSGDGRLPVAQRRLRVRARADVQVVSADPSDSGAVTLKDPVSAAFSQLTAAEFWLFDKLRGPATLASLRDGFQRRFAPRTISVEALQDGVNRLFQQGLLVSESAGQGEQLRERAQRDRLRRLAAGAGRLLCLRVASFGCAGLVDRLYRVVRPAFSPVGLLAAVLLVMAAVWVALANAAEIAARLPTFDQLTRPAMLPVWLLSIAGVKCAHELAHALVARHLGARVQEMGVLLLGFVPALYCDASDAWRLPGKWLRVAVSAAGMGVELLLASAALVAWWNLNPGMLQTAMLSVVITCTVGTLLVNLNPLLRYDGYYILADLTGVSNLASRSRQVVSDAWRSWLAAEPARADPLLPSGARRWLALYAVLSTCYLAVVLLGVYALLLHAARPYRLESAVHTLAGVVSAGMVGPMVYKLVRNALTPARRRRARTPRAVLAALAVCGLLAAVLLAPITHRVRAAASLVPADARPVYASAAGRLDEAIEPGSRVAAGQVVAELNNAETAAEVERLRGECAVLQTRLDQVRVQRALSPQLASGLPRLEAELAAARAELREAERRSADLAITAPREGLAYAAPDRPYREEPGRLARWSGGALEQSNRGCWIEPGTVVAVIGDPASMEALVSIDQADAPRVAAGQRVTLQLDALGTARTEGEVLEISRRVQTQRPAGGDRNNNLEQRHVARVRLTEAPGVAIPGARGWAKIETGRTTLAALVVERAKRLLRFSW